jgi:hypothetical protein
MDNLLRSPRVSKQSSGWRTIFSTCTPTRLTFRPKGRAQALTNAQAYLELERADLSTLKSQVDNQSNRVVQFSGRAKSLLAQVHAALLAKRKSSVEASLRSSFNLRLLHMPEDMIASASFSVIEVVEIGNTLFNYRMADERDLAVDDARRLRERAAGLLEMAVNELEELSIIDVALTPIVKPKPAPTTNVLGTLSQAVAA